MIRASAPYTWWWGSFVLLKMDCVRVERGGSLSTLHRSVKFLWGFNFRGARKIIRLARVQMGGFNPTSCSWKSWQWHSITPWYFISWHETCGSLRNQCNFMIYRTLHLLRLSMALAAKPTHELILLHKRKRRFFSHKIELIFYLQRQNSLVLMLYVFIRSFPTKI